MRRLYQDEEDSLLAGAFRNTMRDLAKDLKDPSLCSEQSYPTGYLTSFIPLDYMNGIRVSYQNNVSDNVYVYDSLGIGEGSINMFIGESGSGKTSAAIQSAASIAQRFKNSMILYEDAEGGLSKARVHNITGWSPRMIDRKLIIRDKGIYIESFNTRIDAHYRNKMELAIKYPTEMTYFTGITDSDGNPLYKMIPTIVIMDSLAQLVMKNDYEDSEMAGNMSAATTAKNLKGMLKKITPKLKEANIILFIVNHINEDIALNVFQKKKAAVNYLKQGETLPGGKAPIYLSNNIFRFNTSTKLSEDKEFGINGFHNKIELIKSRSNRAGRSVPMVFDQEYGFNRTYSCFQMLKEASLVHGSGWYYIDGMPEVKFQ